jgi:NAD(P)-dependent dehydrogenase (short-subunit alcohol dehydrogenase family)
MEGPNPDSPGAATAPRWFLHRHRDCAGSYGRNVADEASVERLFGPVQNALGRVDLVFNNAGVSLPPTPLAEVSRTEWDRVVATNLTGRPAWRSSATRVSGSAADAALQFDASTNRHERGRGNSRKPVGRENVSQAVLISSKSANDSLFGLGLGRARATSPGCQASEVGRSRAVVVLEATIDTRPQEGLHCSRTSVSHRSMQWCHLWPLPFGPFRLGASARPAP